jgi:exopolysaccharide biosynthesis polyprenyl glycosylphosphotransferase
MRRPVLERVSATSVGLILIDVLSAVVVAALDGTPWQVDVAFAGALVMARSVLRLYRPRVRLSWFDDLPRSAASLVVASGVASVVAATVRSTGPEAVQFAEVALVFAATNELMRLLCLTAARHGRRRFGRGQRTLVMGVGTVGRSLAEAMLEHPELGLRPIGAIDPDPRVDEGLAGRLPLLSRNPDDLARIILENRIGTVVVSFALTREAELVDTVITAHRLGCVVLVVPRLFELQQDGPDVERLRGYPLVRLSPDPTLRPTWWMKRVLDVVMAMLGLVLLSPLLALCALAIRLESGRPVLFHQTRVGLDGTPFRIHKLRSLRPMDDEESQSRWNISDDVRLGPVARFVRRTSLDEVPQLWNIMRGDMSFVGPRPERPGFVEVFSVEHERYWARHRVPVGLTGLAQVNGLRGDTSIAERARYDNYYIANWSVWLDAKVVALTVREVLRGGGG